MKYILVALVLFASCTTNNSLRIEDMRFHDSGNPELYSKDIIESSSTIFTEEEEGYNNFRIPVTVKTDKSLIVICEGRYRKHDHGRNDIVLKRSYDDGLTWEGLEIIHTDKSLVMVNPSVTVSDSGRIVLMYETFPHGYHARKEGKIKMLDTGFKEGTTQQKIYLYSDDDGKTWSDPEYLEKTIRFGDFTTAGSPNNGFVIQKGKYKGRIIMPSLYNKRINSAMRNFYTGAVYSDDNGETWIRSEFVPFELAYQTDEVNISEMDNGDLYMNGRPGVPYRSVSRSTDGGHTWSEFKLDKNLFGSPCNSGLLKFSFTDDTNKGMTLFCQNVSKGGYSGRSNGHLYISYNDGETWEYSIPLIRTYFGYSQIVKLSDTKAGIVYEAFDNNDYLTKFITLDLAEFVKPIND